MSKVARTPPDGGVLISMHANAQATRASRAVDDLFRAHAGEVFRYAYAMLGNRADAEDVTQTTFVNALRALERGDRPRKPSNWLISIAHNIVRQRFRQQQSRPAEVELDHDVAVQEQVHDGPSPDDLVRALQRIPPTQRAALVMRELEGRSYKEIEAILETTPAALETLLFRARRSLAEELENLVTCERAELSMSKQIDGRLTRKERRRLDEHLKECGACARLYAGRTKQRRAFGRLALLPLPFSLTFFKGTPSASAAGGLSTIGAGGATAAVGVSAVCGSACSTGGLLAGGLAVKTVAVVAAATMAGSVGYEGVKQVQAHSAKAPEALVAAPTGDLSGAPTSLPIGVAPGSALASLGMPVLVQPESVPDVLSATVDNLPAPMGPAPPVLVVETAPADVPEAAPVADPPAEAPAHPVAATSAPEPAQPHPAPDATGTTITVVLPPAAPTPTPPADTAATPPADKTTAPPADTTTTPPADTTATPPADTTTTPPADTTTTPPADTTPTPAADTTPTQPVDPAPAPDPVPAPAPDPAPIAGTTPAPAPATEPVAATTATDTPAPVTSA